MKTRYEVTENNGGGITLYIWNDGKLIYAHSGYEVDPKSLRVDIEALKNGDDPLIWDGNDLYDWEIIESVRQCEENDEVDLENPLTEEEYYDNNETTKIICTQDGPIPEDNMGYAGKSVFYPKEVSL